MFKLEAHANTSSSAIPSANESLSSSWFKALSTGREETEALAKEELFKETLPFKETISPPPALLGVDVLGLFVALLAPSPRLFWKGYVVFFFQYHYSRHNTVHCS